jgi:hypothetical protein
MGQIRGHRYGPEMHIRVPLAIVALSLVAVASAQAAPASPGFLDAWKKSDQRFAQWDFNGALKAIQPLLGQNDSLDGYERIWFDFSAARVLAVTGDTQQAAQFMIDQHTLTGDHVFDENNGGYSYSTGYEDWWSRNPRGQLGYGQPEFIGINSAQTDVSIQEQALDLASSLSPSIYPNHEAGVLSYDPEGNGIVLSYFAPPKTKLGKYAPRGTCCYSKQRPITTNMFLSRLWGSPVGVDGAIGASLGSKPFVASIPTTQRIVSERSVAPGSTFTVQHFRIPASRRLIATWFPLRRGARTLRDKYSSSGNATRVKAPKMRGVYRLFIGFTKDPGNIAAEVDGVGVGVPAAPASQVGASWRGSARRYPKPRWQP